MEALLGPTLKARPAFTAPPPRATRAPIQPAAPRTQTKSGTVAMSDALAGKTAVGLYFSAHWCPPCRMYTPKLAEQYAKLVAAGKPFEIVFVSSDRD